MISVAPFEAIARFGSTVRGDADQYSDSDLLFLSDTVIRRDRNPFASLGFSVSSFTWRQFDGMASEGSLFLQHLKQECLIVEDQSGRLHRTLERFRPSSDYGSKNAENSRLLALTSGVSDGKASIGWACDLLAIAFRNHAVLDAAAAGTYVFSYPDLVKRAASIHDLPPSAIKILTALRILKREYRDIGMVNNTPLAYVHDAQALLKKITGVDCAESPLTRDDFITKCLSAQPVISDWYYSVRSYEGAYRAINDSTLLNHREGNDLLEYVLRSPSPYSIADFGSLEYVREYVSSILSKRPSDPPAISATTPNRPATLRPLQA